MLSGNNGNTVQPVFMNESQMKYHTNTQSNQLHLLGTSGGGFNVDPVNYFANDNLGTMIQPNKRGREEDESTHNIQRQQQNLHMSLSYDHNNISVQEQVPKENHVSTGLRLSYDNNDQNSSLDDSLRIDLHRQKNELDQFIKIQAAQMAKGVRYMKHRHTAALLTALEKGVSKKLQEKDLEIDSMNKKNKGLAEHIKQVTTEAQNWHYRAKYNESVVNVLKTNLQQAMTQNNNVIVGAADQSIEGFGDSEIDDAASSHIDPNNIEMQRMRCRMCNAKEVSVLVVPCRHLCLCKECDVFTRICPVCNSLKTSSVQVFFS
ncbi:unnamed protein product [Cochlearia groenlandica]